MLDHKLDQPGDGSNGGGSLKEYYGVFGLKEGASLEEVTARYMALKKSIISSIEKGQKPEKTIPEINEAFVKLKESKIPIAVSFDLEEHLRKSFTSVRAERRRARRKKIILASGILTVFLIAGISLFLMESAKETLPPGSASSEDPNLKTKGSLEKVRSFSILESNTYEKKAQVIPKEASKSTPAESVKPAPPKPYRQEPPAASIPKAEDLKGKEKPSLPYALKPAPPVEVAKAAPPEPSKSVIVEKAKPIPPEAAPAPAKEPRELKAKVEAPVVSPVIPPPPKPAPPVEVAKAVPQEPSKPAIAEKAKPIAPEPVPTPAKEPRELEAKVEDPVIPPPPKPVPPVEMAKVAPREASGIAKLENAKVPEARREKEPRVASISPSAIASDQEVRNFFENYLFKYNRKEINGFLSLFSTKAIQNQKDDLQKIRKTYENFFAQMESVDYQIAITGIEPKQDRMEVTARYELEGIVAKGRRVQNWKGQIRWVLIREGGALKILSLDYKPQSNK